MFLTVVVAVGTVALIGWQLSRIWPRDQEQRTDAALALHQIRCRLNVAHMRAAIRRDGAHARRELVEELERLDYEETEGRS